MSNYGNNWYSQVLRQFGDVELLSLVLHPIGHGKGDHHGFAEGRNLGVNEEVTFEVGPIDDANNKVNCFVVNDADGYRFVFGDCVKRIEAGNVDEFGGDTTNINDGRDLLNGNARIVGDFLLGPS